ncbi:MAG TPA: XrtA/PEP-CTERM system histidine kinase PrsK [Acetobacteraceae bacterium]|jgi:putative PEP-CTERM system histidine kinase|nr:XrtA/PEP-CTERM system histidine kinase PrsK [Acetobacteraceae bacterium]
MLTSLDFVRIIYGGSAALYLALSALILIQMRLSRTGLLLVLAALASALWLGAVAVALPRPFGGFGGGLDLLRSVAWYAFLLHLYRRSVPGRSQLTQAFIVMGLVAVLVVGTTLLVGHPGNSGFALWSAGIALRLGLAVCNILLIENLYFNASADTKWRITLPCIALGALSVYDVALSADAVLLSHISAPLFAGNAIAAAIVVPLLAVSAARNRSWQIDIHVSRTVVFHSATLVAAGVFLLGLAGAGEAVRYFNAAWGGLAEISLVFAGCVTIAVLLSSGGARRRARRFIGDHFFSNRYDYRQEWMRCINTLSAQDAYVALHTRVIRAAADIVDSPGGVLLLLEPATAAASYRWAGSWNMPALATPVMADDPLVAAMRGGAWIALLDSLPPATGAALASELPGLWLAVPLSHAGVMTGFILVARPRGGFALDREVFDLLRIIGRQVATYVAEQRATEVLLQARQLHDYGKRFAFVAHDIKNVSSQLSMLLSNAEVHLSNPEFQADMLQTVRASVQKITALLKRLQAPPGDLARAIIRPRDRLRALIGGLRRPREVDVLLDDAEDAAGGVAMPAAAFDAVVTHLLNNAAEATLEASPASAPPVLVRLRQPGRQIVIEIADEGPGMHPEFVRDKLFAPFDTSKPGGTGIGAFQARELLREAGGDLLVLSQPGAGTTMRIVLPAVEAAAAPPAGAAPIPSEIPISDRIR